MPQRQLHIKGKTVPVDERTYRQTKRRKKQRQREKRLAEEAARRRLQQATAEKREAVMNLPSISKVPSLNEFRAFLEVGGQLHGRAGSIEEDGAWLPGTKESQVVKAHGAQPNYLQEEEETLCL